MTDRDPAVLIVEERPLFETLWSRFAARSGCRTVSAPRVEDAVPLAHAERPAVVLVGGGPEGRERALRALAADAATRDLPVVVRLSWEESQNPSAGNGRRLALPVEYVDFVAALAGAGVDLGVEG